MKDDYQYEDDDEWSEDIIIINKCMEFWVLRGLNSSGEDRP